MALAQVVIPFSPSVQTTYIPFSYPKHSACAFLKETSKIHVNLKLPLIQYRKS